MGVARKHEVVAVGGEAVQHAGFGGVGETETQVGRAGWASGDEVVAVAADVRIVDARRGNGEPARGERDPSLRGVEPTAFQQRGAQVAPRQRHPVLALRALPQVAGGVLEVGPK